MIPRRARSAASLLAVAASCFALGAVYTQMRQQNADRHAYDSRLEALHAMLETSIGPGGRVEATSGRLGVSTEERAESTAARDSLMADIKQQLQQEMGLLPLSLIRERRSSFVELYSYDNRGQKSYGTAGYLGRGYFITVKHAVVALEGEKDGRTIDAIRVMFKGKEVEARVVDAGKATAEVDEGDWAILRTRDLDLPPLVVDTAYDYEFADPIFRLGNDYSKGIVVSTGYIGQRTPNGLVTCLTDGHPGASGGGVLDQRGVLVGIPIGRMQGDYRFSFILPLRAEMLRKVPRPLAAAATEQISAGLSAPR